MSDEDSSTVDVEEIPAPNKIKLEPKRTPRAALFQLNTP